MEVHPKLMEKGKQYLIDYFDIKKTLENKAVFENNQSNKKNFPSYKRSFR